MNSVRRRYRIAVLTMMMVAGCSSAPDLETSRQFQEIEQAFTEASSPKEFEQVAGRYQQLINDGLQSGAVFYNQGNAWMRAGQHGRAIACYRQAQRFRPNDPYLSANLQNALNTVGLNTAVSDNSGILGYLFFWQNWFSYAAKFTVTTVLLALLLGCLLLAQFTHYRTTFLRCGLTAGFLFILMAASTARDWRQFEPLKHGVITADEVVARKGNSDSYEPAFTESLPEGTEFIVIDQRADWLQVQLQDALSAWIPLRSATVY